MVDAYDLERSGIPRLSSDNRAQTIHVKPKLPNEIRATSVMKSCIVLGPRSLEHSKWTGVSVK